MAPPPRWLCTTRRRNRGAEEWSHGPCRPRSSFGSLNSPRRCTRATPGACCRCSAASSSPGGDAPSPPGSAPPAWARTTSAYYYFLGALGRKTRFVASLLLRRVADVVAPGERILLGLDDTPTKRYGPHVEGAGIHHNPSPGPAGQKFLYGHVWVTIAWLACHPRWGTIGLPLRALLYVRARDIGRLTTLYGVGFRTKLQMAAELVTWAADWLRYLGKVLWVVADGAYAKRPFLKAARAAGVVVVNPPHRATGQRPYVVGFLRCFRIRHPLPELLDAWLSPGVVRQVQEAEPAYLDLAAEHCASVPCATSPAP